MATTRINATQATVAGVTVTPPTAADLVNGNNYVPNAGRVVLLISTGVTSNVTFTTPETIAGLAVADAVVAVPATAGAIVAVSHADPSAFISSAGQVDFTASAAVNVVVLQA